MATIPTDQTTLADRTQVAQANTDKDSKVCPFPTVLEEELKAIAERRALNHDARAWTWASVDPVPGNISQEATELAEQIAVRKGLRQTAFDNDTVGLAFSGGGIRSATFNLGVLQALAKAKFLGCVDYLSTVSGGGYIGSWWTAWIKREGDPKNVETQLHPNRITQAEAERSRSDSPKVAFDEEPEPIRHLRAYSNYLAPRLSFLSQDGWTLFSSYLRNFLLNQLVLLLAVLFLTLLVSGLLRVFAYAFSHSLPDEVPMSRTATFWLVTALGCVSFAVCCLFINLNLLHDRTDRHPASARKWVLAPLVLSALLFSLAGAIRFQTFGSHKGDAEMTFSQAIWCGVIFLAFQAVFIVPPWGRAYRAAVVDGRGLSGVLAELGSGVVRTFVYDDAVTRRPRSALLRWFLALSSGFLGGMLVYGVICYVGSKAQFLVTKAEEAPPATPPARAPAAPGVDVPEVDVLDPSGLKSTPANPPGEEPPSDAEKGPDKEVSDPEAEEFWELLAGVAPIFLGLVPPLLLIVFALAIYLQIGFLGREVAEPIREWWSALTGLIMLWASVWTLLIAIVTVGPAIVVWSDTISLYVTTKWVAAGSWVGSTLGGLALARSKSSTGRGTSDRVRESIVAVASVVFLVGYVALVSIVSHLLVAEASDWASDSGPLRSFGLVPRLLACPVAALAAFFLAQKAGTFVDINLFSLQRMYANRLVRCYLGASRPKAKEARYGAPNNAIGPTRVPNTLTDLDENDDMALHRLRIRKADADVGPLPREQAEAKRPDLGYRGPYHLINTALNLATAENIAWQERKAESFLLSPLYCGSETTGYRDSREYASNGTSEKDPGIALGSAVSISGAAVSPNMGYHTSPIVSMLLTVFNVRLGAWIGNPCQKATWKHAGPEAGLFYLLREAFGRTTANSPYVYLSDGGHFDNLGVYELVRRRCRFVVCVDAGADPKSSFEDLAMLIRKVNVDLGIRIDVDVKKLRPTGDDNQVKLHAALGRIRYSDVDGGQTNEGLDVFPSKDSRDGLFIYLKPSINGDENPGVLGYRVDHKEFPHESTVDQFFSESQFESYRSLGYHVADDVFSALYKSGANATTVEDKMKAIFDAFQAELKKTCTCATQSASSSRSAAVLD